MRANAGVGMWATQDPGVELAGQPDVVGVPRPAGDFLATLESRMGLADDGQRRVRSPGAEACLPPR